MKILFFGVYFPRPNNPTTGTWALSQVTALRDAGHQVRVISPVPAIPLMVSKLLRRGTSAACPPRHVWNGIETDYVRWPIYPVGPLSRRFKENPRLFLKIAWAITQLRFLAIARKFHPDVIFAHHGQHSGYLASRVARRLGVNFFVTEHSFGEIESCAHNPLRRRHYLDMTRGISGWFAVANRMRDAMHRIFPDAPALTLHNGAELIPAALERVPRPPQLAGHLVVLCVTFFYTRKNVPLLIKSFDAIAGRHPSALLVIGGDGDDRAAVESAVGAARHQSQIVLLGALSHRDVLQNMVWCDVFAHIGINEPFATVFSEAMMAGKPIIFANDGGINDVAKNGVHGLSVEPDDAASAADALDTLLTDGALRQKLGASAGELARRELTWKANASNLTERFQAALRTPVTP